MDVRELRLGSLLLGYDKIPFKWNYEHFGLLEHGLDPDELGVPIPLTAETVEKYIDWEFEFGFNKSVLEKEYWSEHHYLLENIIDGSSDFKIVFSKSKKHLNLEEITYYVDDNLLEFGLDDTLHNLQNLFYIVSEQELPIKL